MEQCKRQLMEYAGLIEEFLPDLIFTGEEANQVEKAMAYSLCGGGKRVRGAMLLAFYRLFAEDVRPVLPFAAALEMVHAYSLIHDDLPCMDDDDLRRGKPACHIAFGESTALLAGDGLLTLAFSVMTRPAYAQTLEAGKVLEAVQVLAHAAGTKGMIGGQVMDIANEGKQVDGERLRETDGKKTGALFCAPAEMACILGGAGAEVVEACLQYARQVGLAFQIVDDILDQIGDEATLGKPINSDMEQNKTTYVSLYGVEACRRMVDDLNRQAKESIASTGLDTGFLCGLADYLTIRQH